MRHSLAVAAVVVTLIVTAAGFTVPAIPEPYTARHVAVQDLATDLAQWIAENSDFQPFEPPAIIFLSGRTIAEATSWPDKPDYEFKPIAAYTAGLIMLPDTFRLDRDESMLLHELVHHAQYLENRIYTCNAEREAEAYALQLKYVAAVGRGLVPSGMFLSLLQCGMP